MVFLALHHTGKRTVLLAAEKRAQQLFRNLFLQNLGSQKENGEWEKRKMFWL